MSKLFQIEIDNLELLNRINSSISYKDFTKKHYFSKTRNKISKQMIFFTFNLYISILVGILLRAQRGLFMNFITMLLIFISVSSVYGQDQKPQNCRNMQELFEEAKDDAYGDVPQGLFNTSLEVDFLNTEICENDKKEIVIITSDKQASAKHLVLTGLYFGYGFLGADGTYQRINRNGGYRDHFRFMGHYFPDLWAGTGFQYGRHIKGSMFYVGANANYIRVFDTVNNYAVGGVIGIEGGKGRVSGFFQVGIRTAFEGDLIETMPQIGFGIRFRIFRR